MNIPPAFALALDSLPRDGKILVTGATSGLGRSAIAYLHHHGIDCKATGRNLSVLNDLQASGIKSIALDLTNASDDELQTLLQDVHSVWHCAALSSPWGKKQAFFDANVLATQRLATWADKIGVRRFVHISTPSLYFDFCHRHQVREDDVRLSADGRFVNHYIHSKFLAEQFLQALKPATMQLVILRPRAIFGEYDKVLLPKILQLYHAKQGTLPLPNGGQVLMDVTFAGNVVYAMTLASYQPLPSALPIYNITNQQPIRLNKLLQRLICDKMNQPLTIKNVPYPVVATLAKTLETVSQFSHKEPRLTAYSAGVLYYDMTLDTTKAEQELGYHAVYDLDFAIGLTANALLTPSL